MKAHEAFKIVMSHMLSNGRDHLFCEHPFDVIDRHLVLMCQLLGVVAQQDDCGLALCCQFRLFGRWKHLYHICTGLIY